MGKAVLHFQKMGKSTGGSLGHHIDRTPGMEHSYRHADPSRLKDNVFIHVNRLCSLPYNEAVATRIKLGYDHRNKAGELKAIRKDAVHSINVMLSGSPEDLGSIASDKNQLKEWIDTNLEWCKKEFGENNIVRFAVHLDEKTPHIHCVFVPITHDGRLSAGDWVSTGRKLESYQTNYAQAMKKFGLERGVKSDRKHQTTADYRRQQAYRLDDKKDILDDLENLRQSDMFGFKKKKESLLAKLQQLILDTDENNKRQIELLRLQISNLEKHNAAIVRDAYNIQKSNFLTKDQINAICNSVSITDYFFNAMERGVVKFERKEDKEFFFSSDSAMYSVAENGFYDFNNKSGGQIIKAVMTVEGLNWKQAVDFLQSISGTRYDKLRKEIQQNTEMADDNTYHVTAILRPNNLKLLSYFYGKGIDPDLIKEHMYQIHYQMRRDGETKNYFGIGIRNNSGGYRVENSITVRQLGDSDCSDRGNKEAKRLVVFDTHIAMLSFLQILRDAEKNEQEYRFICLNSTKNVQRFITGYENFKGEMLLCLDAGPNGDKATMDLRQFFTQAEDIREQFGIFEGGRGSKDLNEALMKSKGIIHEQRKGRGMGM